MTVARTPDRSPIPEWEEHRATILCWPGRPEVWDTRLDAARAEYADLAKLIAPHEPVIVFANEEDAIAAQKHCGRQVEVVAMPSDDAWLHDTGPVFVRRNGSVEAVAFRFNAWGEKYSPYERDAELAQRIADFFGLSVHASSLVLEGGALATDGQTIFTTRSVLLNPNRNPGLTEREVEEEFRSVLGATAVEWISRGLHEDTDTDGHVDNFVWLRDESTAFVLGLPDDHVDAPVVAEARDVLRRNGYEVVEIRGGYQGVVLDGSRAPLSMLNCYAINGALVVPVADAKHAKLAHELFAPRLLDRAVLPHCSPTLGFGGGGAHCVALGVPL